MAEKKKGKLVSLIKAYFGLDIKAMKEVWGPAVGITPQDKLDYAKMFRDIGYEVEDYADIEKRAAATA